MNDAGPATPPADDSLRFRFTRRMRLPNAAGFERVYAAKRKRHVGPLIVFALPNELGFTRLGLSVPRRAGNAVMRHRLKRLLREAFRLLQHELPAGYDVVINVGPHEPLELDAYQQLLMKACAALHEQWNRQPHNPNGHTTPEKE